MLLVCPNCATSYDVDVASLRPAGRRVRCVRCRTVWDAELPRAEQLLAAAEALAPDPPGPEPVAEAAVAVAAPPPLPPDAATEAFEVAEVAPDQPTSEVPGDLPPDAPAPGAERLADAEVPSEEAAAEVESPPLAPVDLDADRPPIEVEAEAAPEPPPLEDIETVAARRYPARAKRRGLHWPLSRLQSGILALIVLNAIVVGWRADFVRAMPQTAAFYAAIGLPVNLRGLSFDSIATTTEENEGLPILVIGGNIVNTTSKPVDVPRLRFAVRNAARQEIYSWTAVPPRAELPPRGAVAFHTRLASPPPDAHDVLVRFVNRYDIMTGTR